MSSTIIILFSDEQLVALSNDFEITIFLAAETILLDVSEYLRFEIEMLPDELLMSEFCKEVDFLRDETELTSKRIDRLNFSLSENRHNS